MEKITSQQGSILVRLARQVIEGELGITSAFPVTDDELSSLIYQEKRGVFVTLHKREALRGCIGSLIAEESMLDGIRRHALNAAFNDYRFEPVKSNEASELHVEVSILTIPETVEYQTSDELLECIRPGVDGVILKGAGGKGATFLPQVWKQLSEPSQFFGQLCQKAGLSTTYWQTNKPEIQSYQVQLFEEPVL